MKPQEILSRLIAWGPVLFGVGFLAPLIAQSMDALGLEAPMGLSSIGLGLVVGASAGFVAKSRGSWV